VKITGTGTATPPGEKFPGAYGWRDPGLLVNIHYGPKRYVCPVFNTGKKDQLIYFNRLLLVHPSIKANATHLKAPFPLRKKLGN
jgi:hypothetical protein